MKIAASHRGTQARPWRASMRRLGLAMVVLLAMAQFGAAAHFVLVRHSLSPSAGVLVHCGDDDSSGSDKHSPIKTRHQRCEIFAVLSQASNVAGPVPTIEVPDVVVQESTYRTADRDVLRAWPIFRLAPSQSPPVGAV
jgi:hypothetical protein